MPISSKYPRLKKSVRLLVAGLILSLLLLQFYAWRTAHETIKPYRHKLLSFPETQQALKDQATPGDEITFAVIGDPKAKGIYMVNQLLDQLKSQPVDFVVALGDVSKSSAGYQHHFRREILNPYDLNAPFLPVIGNHEIEFPNRYGLSDFEHDYGKSYYSFTYKNSRFVILRTIGSESLDAVNLPFLAELAEDQTPYDHTYVFMHIPPAIPAFDNAKFTMPLTYHEAFKKINTTAVFAGHFHGYANTTLDGIKYIVTGGGGSHFDNKKQPQFFHAMLIRSGKNYLTEDIIPLPLSLKYLGAKLRETCDAKIYPLMAKYRYLTLFINTLLILTLLFMLSGPALIHTSKPHRPLPNKKNSSSPCPHI